MPSNSRETDLWAGVCTCHSDPNPIPMTGIIITASNDRTVNNLGQARITDITIGMCGHAGVIVGGRTTSTTNNLANAGIGDPVAGCNIGVIITASGDSISG